MSPEERQTYMDLTYLGSRKRHDLLSRLGVWDSWGAVEGGGGKEGNREKYIAQYKQLKLSNMNINRALPPKS